MKYDNKIITKTVSDLFYWLKSKTNIDIIFDSSVLFEDCQYYRMLNHYNEVVINFDFKDSIIFKNVNNYFCIYSINSINIIEYELYDIIYINTDDYNFKLLCFSGGE